MELIVISSPTVLENEATFINQLFDEGLSIFHLRKPTYSEEEVTSLLHKIDSKHHSKIVLHQYFHLMELFSIKRIHFSEILRKEMHENEIQKWNEKKVILSTSVHTQSDFEKLDSCFSYAFVGPVFDSISKIDYKASKEGFDFSNYDGTIQPIALGGVSSTNVQQLANKGFRGVAVLGTIWNKPKDSLQNWKEMKKAIHHIQTIDTSDAK